MAGPNSNDRGHPVVRPELYNIRRYVIAAKP
jgi:hypothetical protein